MDVCYPKNCKWLGILLSQLKSANYFTFLYPLNNRGLRKALKAVSEKTRIDSGDSIDIQLVALKHPTQAQKMERLPIVCHTADEKAVGWADQVIEQLKSNGTIKGLRLSVPWVEDDGDPESFVRLARIAAWGSMGLPPWEPYDSIDHFLQYGWPDFESRQQEAGEIIFKPLSRLTLTGIHDVGCGSGEILKHLGQLYSASKKAPPQFFGYDPSECQVEKAKHLLGEGVTIEKGRLEDADITDDASAVLFLGNTLAHIGAENFRKWLKGLRCQPLVILIDFASNWSTLLGQASPEIVCDPVGVFSAGTKVVYAHMTTAGGPGWVKRGIILDFVPSGQSAGANNPVQFRTHRLFTRQFADEPATYANVLQARGYDCSESVRYDSGWGPHELWVYRYSGIANIRWPKIAAAWDEQICDEWYKVLEDCWKKAVQSQLGKGKWSFDFYPAAIVPFCKDKVYARYIRRGDEESRLNDLFSAWMWVVDPRTQGLQQSGATKLETELPFAPSIHRTMLGYSPAAVLESFDVLANELRLDLNASDLELADLERLWILKTAEVKPTAFYGLPIYVRGLPCFLIIIRADEFMDAASVYGACRLEVRRISNALEQVLDDAKWSRFVNVLQETGVPEAKVSNMLQYVSDQTWGSWIDTLPGGSLHAPTSADQLALDKWKKSHLALCRKAYSQETKKLAVGILFALKEELNCAVGGLGLQPAPHGRDHEYIGLLNLDGVEISIWSWFVGEMGQTATAIFATQLFLDEDVRDDFDLLVLVGIAAGLKDCCIGDVLVADNINHYAASMEAVKKGDEWQVNPGGHPYETTQVLVEWCKNTFIGGEKYKAWQQQSIGLARQLLGDKKWTDVISLRTRKDVVAVVGKLASGNIVAKCDAFHNQFSAWDRLYKALDMESAAFLAAAKATNLGVPRMVVRGISDPGDETKKELEELFDGKLREWAVVNCISYLRAILSESTFRQLITSLRA